MEGRLAFASWGNQSLGNRGCRAYLAEAFDSASAEEDADREDGEEEGDGSEEEEEGWQYPGSSPEAPLEGRLAHLTLAPADASPEARLAHALRWPCVQSVPASRVLLALPQPALHALWGRGGLRFDRSHVLGTGRSGVAR
jgi:hypothetical protein